jgi:hypothetical protein
MQPRYEDDRLLGQLATFVQHLGHFPVRGELRMRRRQDADFPNDKVFDRFGHRTELITVLREWCGNKPDYLDVYEVCTSLLAQVEVPEEPRESPVIVQGFVYMIRSGDRYKIGQTANLGRRTDEVIRQQAMNAHLVHSIPTDDPVGIERYWHERFADRRYKGEWFVLTREDVAAFKRRRTFM